MAGLAANARMLCDGTCKGTKVPGKNHSWFSRDFAFCIMPLTSTQKGQQVHCIAVEASKGSSQAIQGP
eukprot:1155681-Pelagomonas_calceolata.AAC.9